MASHGIDHSIKVRTRIVILWVCLIQVDKINAQPLLLQGLLYQLNISELVSIFYFPNKAYFEELLYLIIRGVVPLHVKSSSLLSHQLMPGVYLKVVDGKLRSNTRHFILVLSKDLQ